MLDLGFEPQIRKLVHRTRPDRQTMLFTATWPRQVADAARAFARDAVVVRVGVVDAAATSRGVSHVVRRVEEEGKYSALVRALEEALGAEDTDVGRVIVFYPPRRGSTTSLDGFDTTASRRSPSTAIRVRKNASSCWRSFARDARR